MNIRGYELAELQSQPTLNQCFVVGVSGFSSERFSSPDFLGRPTLFNEPHYRFRQCLLRARLEACYRCKKCMERAFPKAKENKRNDPKMY